MNWIFHLDTGLIRAVGVTPANAAEASVTEAISADLAEQAVFLSVARTTRTLSRTAQKPL